MPVWGGGTPGVWFEVILKEEGDPAHVGAPLVVISGADIATWDADGIRLATEELEARLAYVVERFPADSRPEDRLLLRVYIENAEPVWGAVSEFPAETADPGLRLLVGYERGKEDLDSFVMRLEPGVTNEGSVVTEMAREAWERHRDVPTGTVDDLPTILIEVFILDIEEIIRGGYLWLGVFPVDQGIRDHLVAEVSIDDIDKVEFSDEHGRILIISLSDHFAEEWARDHDWFRANELPPAGFWKFRLTVNGLTATGNTNELDKPIQGQVAELTFNYIDNWMRLVPAGHGIGGVEMIDVILEAWERHHQG